MVPSRGCFFSFKSSVVKFPICGYPGPSKELGTEVRIMQGQIFRSKIRMYLQLYVVRNYDFKTISFKEMETNFVRIKVPEVKKYLRVRGISVPNMSRE